MRSSLSLCRVIYSRVYFLLNYFLNSDILIIGNILNIPSAIFTAPWRVPVIISKTFSPLVLKWKVSYIFANKFLSIYIGSQYSRFIRFEYFPKLKGIYFSASWYRLLLIFIQTIITILCLTVYFKHNTLYLSCLSENLSSENLSSENLSSENYISSEKSLKMLKQLALS